MKKNNLTYRELITNWAVDVNENVAERDASGQFSRVHWERLGALGGTGWMCSSQFGGQGATAVECASMLEDLGYLCSDGGLTFAFAAHLLACVVPILRYGNEEQKRVYLPKLASGHWVAANAITEETSGSDAFSMRGTAQRVGSYFHIKSAKTYVSNGPEADVMVVYVMTDPNKGFVGGASCFVLNKEEHQWICGSTEHKLGLRTCSMSVVDFDLKVHETSLLGKEGRGGQVFHESMTWERALLPALYIGTLERLMEKVISFVRKRVSGGQPISRYQAISHKIVDIKTNVHASRMMIQDAAKALDTEREVTEKTCMAKLFVSQVYQESMKEIMQIMGGAAFRGHNEFERHFRDAVAATMYSGSTEVQKNIVARALRL